MRRSSIIFAVVVLAILIIVAVLSLGLPYKGRLFPLIAVIPISALVVVQVIREVRAKTSAEKIPQEEQPDGEPLLGNRISAAVWIVALLPVIYLFGFLAGFPLYTFLYLKLHRQSWSLSIIIPVVMLTVIYVGFNVALNMPLYKGLVFM